MARSERERHVGIAHRRVEFGDAVLHRIENRNDVGGVFRRAEQRAVAVDRRVALVGRNLVVQIMLVVGPVPRGDDDVALDALRPLRFVFGQLALGDAVGPFGEIFDRRRGEIAGDEVDHQRAGLAGLHAARPGFFRGFEFAKPLRQRARGEPTELMAADAAIVLHGVEPVGLLDLVRNVAMAAELVGAGNFQHRIPVDRRIDFCGFRGIRRRHGFEIELLAGLGFDLRRIGEAIAADPDRVFGLRQIGHDVAALIVGDDHLGVAGRQVVSLGDHPDAGFRAVRRRHHAADVGLFDRDRGLGPRLRPDKTAGETDCRDAQVEAALPRHHTLPDSSSLHEYLAAGGTVSYGTVCGLRLCKNVPNSTPLCNGAVRI